MAKKYISKYTGPEIDSGLDNIPKLEGKLTELESNVGAILPKEGRYSCNAIASKAIYYASSSMVCKKIRTTKDSIFYLKGFDSESSRLWATLDIDGNVVRNAEYSGKLTEAEVTIAEGECYIVFNSYSDKDYALRLKSGIAQVVADLILAVSEELELQKSAKAETDRVINEKIAVNSEKINTLGECYVVRKSYNGEVVTETNRFVLELSEELSEPVISIDNNTNEFLFISIESDKGKFSTGINAHSQRKILDKMVISSIKIFYQSGKEVEGDIELKLLQGISADDFKRLNDADNDIVNLSEKTIGNGMELFIDSENYIINSLTARCFKNPFKAGEQLSAMLKNTYGAYIRVCFFAEDITGVAYGSEAYNAVSKEVAVQSNEEGVYNYITPSSADFPFIGVILGDRGQIARIYKNGKSLQSQIEEGSFATSAKITEAKFDISKNAKIPFAYRVYDKDGMLDNTQLGEEHSVCEIDVPLKENCNIRFKFLITDNLMNSDKFPQYYYKIFSGLTTINARRIDLNQETESYTINGITKTSKIPHLKGGYQFVTEPSKKIDNGLGEFAFRVRYVGSGSSATIWNRGMKMLLFVDGTRVGDFAYETYNTMTSLYNAIASVEGFEVEYGSIEGRTPYDLAVFPQTELVSSYYMDTQGLTPSQTGYSPLEFTDKAWLHIPFGISGRWHNAEVVCFGNKIYYAIDGLTSEVITRTTSTDDVTTLVFGDKTNQYGLLIKDVEIHCEDVSDAELFESPIYNTKPYPILVSSQTPFPIVFEGHGIVDDIMDANPYPYDDLSTTPDRLQGLFTILSSKGYIPITLEQIVRYYKFGESIPKRCFTLVFDGYRFNNFLNHKSRSVFTFNGVFANLAVTKKEEESLYYNGKEISIKDAIAIGEKVGFKFYSHTYNHRYLASVKLSEVMSEIEQDMIVADEMGIDPKILIYPYGNTTLYTIDCLKWMGKLGAINVWANSFRHNNPYCIDRQEIGQRQDFHTMKKCIL